MKWNGNAYIEVSCASTDYFFAFACFSFSPSPVLVSCACSLIKRRVWAYEKYIRRVATYKVERESLTEKKRCCSEPTLSEEERSLYIGNLYYKFGVAKQDQTKANSQTQKKETR